MDVSDSKKNRTSAMLAKCHDCMGYYLDGKVDCENPRCSLYPWMPYRKKPASFKWAEHSPRKIGIVRWEDIQVSESTRNRFRKSSSRGEGEEKTQKEN
jgi:hypothetical protein